MRYLIRTFLRGLLVVVPLSATIWILATVFLWIDGLILLPFSDSSDTSWKVPGTELKLRHGLGFLMTLGFVFAVGILATNVLTRWIVRRIDRTFTNLPVVKLIYTSVKDMIEAFVSEEKKFDKPVLLSFAETPEVEVIGFVTRESLAELGRPDKVAVYVPQSYNFAANLILVPHERVTPIDLPAGDVMALVVSGGVSGGDRSDDD